MFLVVLALCLCKSLSDHCDRKNVGRAISADKEPPLADALLIKAHTCYFGQDAIVCD